jgi:hypothetical protein
MPSNPFFI